MIKKTYTIAGKEIEVRLNGQDVILACNQTRLHGFNKDSGLDAMGTFVDICTALENVEQVARPA